MTRVLVTREVLAIIAALHEGVPVALLEVFAGVFEIGKAGANLAIAIIYSVHSGLVLLVKS